MKHRGSFAERISVYARGQETLDLPESPEKAFLSSVVSKLTAALDASLRIRSFYAGSPPALLRPIQRRALFFYRLRLYSELEGDGDDGLRAPAVVWLFQKGGVL